MMNEDQVLELLQKVGAFRSGHFVLTSGRHADSYILKDAMYAYTRETSRVCREMAERFKDAGVEAVIGPAVGAALLAQWTAYHMSELTGREVFGVYADKDGQGGFIIKRGYDMVIQGKKTLVVEDLTTTGGSIAKVVEAVRGVGADVVGAIALVNRGEVKKEQVGNPRVFDQLLSVHLESWDEKECELCEKGIPVNTDIGHGKEFLARKG
ncbi:orotate phosphoribosyltransferase [Candidatus Kaiserbacteria bacterium CG10_big_fil_rev_8_21_14_0_10_51_14]|uniref:Orotate phosphoribosyltransferase n=1 Tax=Candidatus Kaiserbacteria bacterium CG10_big_fil_rev_8_21_14_0_10_51_14 TaxID=1974610 RepID=A0A2H0UBC7_9BACT|nr:MAG: orotate phosphoribosyltransferase [Candidatus Kaiserbacteria bacterium CG10_big_fil_rev_8_21_14_0_10_51_14]